MPRIGDDRADDRAPGPPPPPDPEVDRFIATAVRRGFPAADPLAQPLAEARCAAERHYRFMAGPMPVPATVDERVIDGPAGPLALRFYRPDHTGPEPAPVLVWFHGGGFVLNSLATHDRLLRLLARRAGVVVCGVAYSRAPEHRFPTQLDEAAAALRWLAAHGAAAGIDPSRLAVGGDSAGANIALNAALAARDGGPPVALGVLLYGMFAADFDTGSHRRFGDGRYGLSTARMRWYWDRYLGNRPVNERAAPLLADHRGLAPMLLAGAGIDCLLDDTLRLADSLAAADVPHRLLVCPRLPHSFAQMTRVVRSADRAVSDIAAAIGRALGSVAGARP
ncbi:alpha/beta hydrolase fold domain-containing protein [Azospirillum halopraeferens]|uniref:alpha/beta hydrolase fold domain-containing protein n=1 Tax=Azospirillum halopraeferens TaxID=34010 RepID=UPI00040AE909|nr:alpha/beta hydrolase [Azospirillum halopraeferens]